MKRVLASCGHRFISSGSVDPLHRALVCSDGTKVMSLTYLSKQALCKGKIVVAPATAVGQRFYRHFAEYASSNGFDVMSVDYRGIGLSSPLTSDVRELKTDYRDWGKYDVAAAVDSFNDPSLPCYLVGHSYGGHVMGLLPNHDKITAAYVFGTGSGNSALMISWWERAKVWIAWNIAGPILVRTKGYLALGDLGLGENVPTSVFLQWRRWCSYTRFYFDDPEVGESMRKAFSAVKAPIRAINATDDPWATTSSRDAFMQAYVGTTWSFLDVKPQDVGMKNGIGHMGYFKRGADQILWKDCLEWLDAEGKKAMQKKKS